MTAKPTRGRDGAPPARDEELLVTCKTCGFLVATGLRARASDLEVVELPSREHRCPRCGAAHAYGNQDYRYWG